MSHLNYKWDVRKFPDALMYPEEFAGGEHLCFSCTQTDLPASQQKKLVSKWLEFLPTINVTTVSFASCLTQDLLDAICQINGLRHLWIKWSLVSELDSILSATKLTHFYLGDSAKLTSIDPLLKAPALKSVELHGLKSFRQFDALSNFVKLESLSFEGSRSGDETIRMPSYEPFANLLNLSELSLASTRAIDGSLEPLHNLKQLKQLYLPNYYSVEQVAFLHKNLSTSTQCSLFSPYVDYIERCETCNSPMVMLTGASRPFICPICKEERFLKHCANYASLAGLPSNNSFKRDRREAAAP